MHQQTQKKFRANVKNNGFALQREVYNVLNLNLYPQLWTYRFCHERCGYVCLDKNVVIKLLVVGILSYVLFIAIGYLLTTVMCVSKFLKGTYICMIVFGDSTFIEYPVVQELYGDVAIFYVTTFHMPFNLLIFTLAPYRFRKDTSFERNTQTFKKASLWDILSNGLIVSILVLIIYFGNITLPNGFYSVISFVSNITAPLSIICIGSSLAKISLSQIKNKKWIQMMTSIRLIVVPFVTWHF